MTREQLAHVLRAAATTASDGDILVVGSQAILGSYPESELPEVAWLSRGVLERLGILRETSAPT